MLIKLESLGSDYGEKKNYHNMLRIPERHGQTDLLYQYRASVCWRAIKTHNSRLSAHPTKKACWIGSKLWNRKHGYLKKARVCMPYRGLCVMRCAPLEIVVPRYSAPAGRNFWRRHWLGAAARRGFNMVLFTEPVSRRNTFVGGTCASPSARL